MASMQSIPESSARTLAHVSATVASGSQFASTHSEVSLELLDRGLELLERRRARAPWYLNNQLYPAIDRTEGRVAHSDVWGLHDNIMHHPLEPCIITPMTLSEALSEYKHCLHNTSGQGSNFDRAPLITSLNVVSICDQMYEDAGLHGIPITHSHIGAQVVGRTSETGAPLSNIYKPRPVSLTVQPPWRQPCYILNGRGVIDQTANDMLEIERALKEPPKMGVVGRGKHLVQKMTELSNNNSYIIVVWGLKFDVLLQCIRQVPARDSSSTASVKRDVFERVAGQEALGTVDNLRDHVRIIENYAKMRTARTLDQGFDMVELGILTLSDFRVLSTNDILLEFDAMHLDGPPATVAGFCHVLTHTGESHIRREQREEIQTLLTTSEQTKAMSEIKRYRKTNARGTQPSSSRTATGYNMPGAAQRMLFVDPREQHVAPSRAWQPNSRTGTPGSSQRTPANLHAEAVGRLFNV